jgi:hypothetical protein
MLLDPPAEKKTEKEVEAIKDTKEWLITVHGVNEKSKSGN